eukprot:TRINITY_DN4897_c0_g1_i8.p1 TRINITY_DN4897_c0_g1~~TRINITY_DN4897_c0_g1_i8.p1  ORF type:complete len:264 (-),score=36.49 TRINITY_DN4897_c0_g1_i8:420-1211(-)
MEVEKKFLSPRELAQSVVPILIAAGTEGVSHKQLVAQLKCQYRAQDLAQAMNVLLNNHVIQLMTNAAGESVYVKAVKTEQPSAIKDLNADQLLVYQVIQSSGNEGIWVRDLTKKTNVANMAKVLKVLEAKQLVRQFKSVMMKNKKLYILYNLEEAEHHKGTTFHDKNMAWNSALVQELGRRCFAFIKEQTFASIDTLKDFFTSQFPQQSLTTDDVTSIVNTLIYDGLVESFKHPVLGEIVYKLTHNTIPPNGLTFTPCGKLIT